MADETSNSTTHTRLSGAAALGVLASGLTACGGGGGGGSSGGGTPPPPPPPPALNYTDTEAARFLLQAQFAVTPADITSVRTLGYDAWLTQQFNGVQSQSGTEWLNSRNWHLPDEKDKYFNPVACDWMAWRMMMTGSDQLRKRCALALSEMMVASANPIDGFWPPYVIAGYWDILNAHAFGNFRTLLEEITLNPAMGFYLNTKGNQKEDPATGRVPDENYAREIMQLFTIGLYELNADGTLKLDGAGKPKETYGQSDITNLARVFTGYDWNYDRVNWQTVSWLTYKVPSTEFARDRMKFDASKHSTQAVTFLGVTIPANTPGVEALKIALDTLFNHANTGPFVAHQMIQRLVTSNPSPAYVGRVATAFANNGSGVRGDMQAVWRAILTDTEARTLPTNNRTGKLREPIIRWAQWARTFTVTSATGKWEIYDTSNGDWGLGQSPLRPPSVFNYFRPGYIPPQTALATSGDVAPEFQIHNETTTAGYINFLTSVLKDGYSDVKPSYAAVLGIAHNSRELLDWLNLHLSANQVSETTIALIQGALDAQTVTATSPESAKLDRIYNAVLLIMACPEYLIQK
ncbi:MULTISPECIES: DUF1800 family protein [Asticcacaulis]|uniref:DUF1800 domain-containing protein n=1 Tax=Asticcacaulis TaxID=76890 RepID=UPI001AE10F19|nr:MULTISPECIES: DUF1800 domain-containing protein [Asticcacaulis]MBP2157532.1 uncharacterized protein (DUF1800 family) [Asticcacaulis solisilvae]MDR6798577.1 uncharacterized protein (DUF1800 family) [Asticcacaulis sp. BE141]